MVHDAHLGAERVLEHRHALVERKVRVVSVRQAQHLRAEEEVEERPLGLALRIVCAHEVGRHRSEERAVGAGEEYPSVEVDAVARFGGGGGEVDVGHGGEGVGEAEELVEGVPDECVRV